MRLRKVTAIRTDTTERWVVRRTEAAGRADLCSACGCEPVWLSIADACQITELSAADVCRLVESGELHGSVTSEGHLLICWISLGAEISRLANRDT